MIHTLTLNPAIDRILYLPELKRNITNRIFKQTDTLGGKGTHVSINLNLLGLTNNAFGICHGSTGHHIITMLKEQGIKVSFNHYETGESRTNYLLIEESGDCTIIAEPGVLLTGRDLEQLTDTMEKTINPNDYLILSGDASNSPDPSIYNHITKKLSAKNLRIFLDTSGDSLKECVLASPFMIKPNLDELSALCGKGIEETTDSIIKAIGQLEKYNITVIAVSLGNKGSIIKCPEGIYHAIPPAVDVKNTIGCGDCFLAGFVYGIYNHLSITETIRTATAVSAATTESAISAGYDPSRAAKLKEQVTVKKIAD